nr:phosphoglycolate phosphatase [Chiayiivirga flava]
MFDLDGTLVDSLGDLHAAVQRVADDLGRAPVPVDVVRPAVSRGGRGMLAAAFPDLDDARRETLLQPFLDHYAASIAARSAPFDGMLQVLDRIEGSGARWGIVTNKAEALARKLVDALGLLPRCAVLIGGDTLAQRKPHPLQLQVACERLGLACGDAVYIGDDRRDADAAAAAGMRAVAAAWGYRDADDDIHAWGADVVLASPHDLLAPGAMRAR